MSDPVGAAARRILRVDYPTVPRAGAAPLQDVRLACGNAMLSFLQRLLPFARRNGRGGKRPRWLRRKAIVLCGFRTEWEESTHTVRLDSSRDFRLH